MRKTIAVALIAVFSGIVFARLPQPVPKEAREPLETPPALKAPSRQASGATSADLANLVKMQTEAIKALSGRVKALEGKLSALEERTKRLELRR